MSWAADDKLVMVREYVPENPKQMISLRALVKDGVRQLSRLDVLHEKELQEQKKTEVTSKDVAKQLESTIVWYRPQELKIEYGEDGPPKRGQESEEVLTQRKREEGRLGVVYTEKNLPPDDPMEPASEPDYDPTTVPVFVAESDGSLAAMGGTVAPPASGGLAAGGLGNPVAGLAPLLGLMNPSSFSSVASFMPVGAGSTISAFASSGLFGNSFTSALASQVCVLCCAVLCVCVYVCVCVCVCVCVSLCVSLSHSCWLRLVTSGLSPPHAFAHCELCVVFRQRQRQRRQPRHRPALPLQTTTGKYLCGDPSGCRFI